MSTRGKLKRRIRILGHDVEIVWKKDMQDFGTYSEALQQIEMELAMPMQMAETTMLHEILEALISSLKVELKHDDLERLEAGLYAVLSDAGVDLTPLVKEKT